MIITERRPDATGPLGFVWEFEPRRPGAILRLWVVQMILPQPRGQYLIAAIKRDGPAYKLIVRVVDPDFTGRIGIDHPAVIPCLEVSEIELDIPPRANITVVHTVRALMYDVTNGRLIPTMDHIANWQRRLAPNS